MLLLLAACACPRFEGMRVDDPRGIATAAQVAAAERAIADFAAWTTVEGVCVPAVEFVDSVGEEDADAAYLGERKPIEVVPTEAAFTYDLVLHELCHAWDTHQGRPSADLPELFATSGHDEALAPDTWFQAGESFAQACEGGIEAARIDALLAERCGVELPGAWVSEHVFDAAVDVAVDEAPWASTRETVVLWDAAPMGVFAAAPGGVWGAVTPSTVGVWNPDTGDWIGGFSLTGLMDGGSWTLGGGESLAVLPLFDATEVYVLGVGENGEGRELGRLPRAQTGTDLVAVSTTDRAYVFDQGETVTTWWELALDGSGVVDEGTTDTWTLTAGAVDDEVFVLGGGWLLARTDEGWEPRVRASSAVSTTLAPLADGGFVVLVRAEGVDTRVRSLARFQDGRWSLPADPCGADALTGRIGVTTSGGRVWAWEVDEGAGEVRYSALAWE